MPFKSKAQRRAMWQKAERGEIPRETVQEWERKTDLNRLPERVGTVNRSSDRRSRSKDSGRGRKKQS